jgi:hypothetical protein
VWVGGGGAKQSLDCLHSIVNQNGSNWIRHSHNTDRNITNSDKKPVLKGEGMISKGWSPPSKHCFQKVGCRKTKCLNVYLTPVTHFLKIKYFPPC